jgi:hypothetical protein
LGPDLKAQPAWEDWSGTEGLARTHVHARALKEHPFFRSEAYAKAIVALSTRESQFQDSRNPNEGLMESLGLLRKAVAPEVAVAALAPQLVSALNVTPLMT